MSEKSIQVPEWFRNEASNTPDRRPIPDDIQSALEYFSLDFKRESGEGAMDGVTIVPETDYIKVTAGELEVHVYEPTPKLGDIRVRTWINGKEKSPFTIHSRTSRGENKHVKAAYELLHERAMR